MVAVIRASTYRIVFATENHDYQLNMPPRIDDCFHRCLIRLLQNNTV